MCIDACYSARMRVRDEKKITRKGKNEREIEKES